MNPVYYNKFAAFVQHFWREYDLLIAAGVIGTLAFIGLWAIGFLYVKWWGIDITWGGD